MISSSVLVHQQHQSSNHSSECERRGPCVFTGLVQSRRRRGESTVFSNIHIREAPRSNNIVKSVSVEAHDVLN